MDKVILTVKIDREKHSRFKSICTLQHKNMQETYENLIDRYIEDNKEWLPENIDSK